MTDSTHRPPRQPAIVHSAFLMTLACVLIASLSSHVAAQDVPPGDSGRDIERMLQNTATGLATPDAVIDADLAMTANRTTTWSTGQTHHILLENDVELSIGAYGFKADRAYVEIKPYTQPGINARDIAVYFDNVRELGGYGPIKQRASRLLVTSRTIGKVKLDTDSMNKSVADADPFVSDARQRITRYRDTLAANTRSLPDGDPLIDPQTFAKRQERREQVRKTELPKVPEAVTRRPSKTRSQDGDRPAAQPGDGQAVVVTPPRQQEADVDFRADQVVYKQDENEGYILLTGGITVMYTDPASGRHLTLTADRAVVFTEPDLLKEAGGTTPAGKVRGVYLEDNVIATDGDYTLRGPRIFYDLNTNQAVVLEAVFFTWDVKKQVPLYVRADKIRQHSLSQWSAKNARLSTSEFYEPHFSIGADSLTVTQDESPDGQSTHRFDAEGMRLNAGNASLFYWPSASGEAGDTPLRRVQVGGSSRRGVEIETAWDLFNLIDKDKPDGVDASLLVDGYTQRGPAVGINMDYDVDKAFGELESYYLYDDGEDEPGGRDEVDPQTKHRARILWRHRHQLPDDWEATAEFAYLSDPNFLEEFFSEDAYASKEYETLLYLKQQRDDWAFTFLGKYDLHDFVPQMDLLQGRGNVRPGSGIGSVGAAPIGYTTDKLPELAYYRIGTPLWDDRLTWYSENRLSRMKLNFPEDTPAERGFNMAESLALFGLGNTTSFDSGLRAAGLDQDTRLRGDTRQEIAAPLKFGDVYVTPYAVGRATYYSDDFAAYAGETDNLRLWGALGVRASTSFSRTYTDVESELLDLHKIRHIIEPSINLFYAQTTINQESLPVFDFDVESLAEGGVARFGIRNTFQTQRGGEGNWRSVDWLRIDTDFVMATDETQRESFIGRFFDHRPENSLVDDYLYNEVALQLTDTFQILNEINFNFDRGDVEQWNLGFQLDHTPRLTSFTMLRMIDKVDSFIATYGFEYMLTPKYHIGFAHSVDIDRGRSRNLTLTFTRRLPRTLLIVAADFDTVSDASSIGVALAPEGFGGRGGPAHNPFLFARE